MNDVIPSTWGRWAAVVILLLIFLGPGPYIYYSFFGPPVPILVTNAKVRFNEAKTAVIIDAEDREYTTACEQVLISRWLVTSNGRVDADARMVTGPLNPPQSRIPPHRVVKIEPRKLEGSSFIIPIPDWVLAADPPEHVLGVVAEASVSKEKPCKNGFSGRYQLYELILPDAIRTQGGAIWPSNLSDEGTTDYAESVSSAHR